MIAMSSSSPSKSKSYARRRLRNLFADSSLPLVSGDLRAQYSILVPASLANLSARSLRLRLPLLNETSDDMLSVRQVSVNPPLATATSSRQASTSSAVLVLE